MALRLNCPTMELHCRPKEIQIIRTRRQSRFRFRKPSNCRSISNRLSGTARTCRSSVVCLAIKSTADPIYVLEGYGEKGELESIPIQKGDLILGINGAGFTEDPVKQWRDACFNDARKGDWKVKIARCRAGKVETITIDTSKILKKGSDSVVAYVAEKEAEEKKLIEEGGEYYAKLMERIKEVLADPRKYHPAYDPEQGFELAGFVWLGRSTDGPVNRCTFSILLLIG